MLESFERLGRESRQRYIRLDLRKVRLAEEDAEMREGNIAMQTSK